MAAPDLLFGLRNNFYLGAYQAAINNSNIPNLSQEDAVERDSLVYRSYIALGSYQVLQILSLSPLSLSSDALEFVEFLFRSRDFSACDQRDRFVGRDAPPSGEIARIVSLESR